MLKNRKSLVGFLSLVMLLAMACGAWAAAIPPVVANGVEKNESGEITISGQYGTGIDANNGGKATFEGSVSASNGTSMVGAIARNKSYVHLVSISVHINGSSGNVNDSTGVYALSGGSVDISSGTVNLVSLDITRDSGRGISARERDSLINASCDINIEGGKGVIGAFAEAGGRIMMFGDISHIGGVSGTGAMAYDNGYLNLVGNVESDGNGVTSTVNSNAVYSGNITVHGETSLGIVAAAGSNLTMNDGSITAADSDTSWSVFIEDGTVNLNNVTAEGANLLKTTNSGTLNAAGGSVLAGNVLHDGSAEGVLDITITDSSLSGAANASGDIGTININLEGSNWNITGDSNTNGAVTGDGNSVIDYTLASDDTTVIIDSLKGNPELNIKPGDKLIIRDSDGVIVDFSASDDDVITVIKTDDGYEITSVGDGPATVTLSYQLPDGGIVTYEFGVVSGTGNKPESNANNYGGGGSSNCNAGFGAGAILSLLGLALVLKRK